MHHNCCYQHWFTEKIIFLEIVAFFYYTNTMRRFKDHVVQVYLGEHAKCWIFILIFCLTSLSCNCEISDNILKAVWKCIVYITLFLKVISCGTLQWVGYMYVMMSDPHRGIYSIICFFTSDLFVHTGKAQIIDSKCLKVLL